MRAPLSTTTEAQHTHLLLLVVYACSSLFGAAQGHPPCSDCSTPTQDTAGSAQHRQAVQARVLAPDRPAECSGSTDAHCLLVCPTPLQMLTCAYSRLCWNRAPHALTAAPAPQALAAQRSRQYDDTPAMGPRMRLASCKSLGTAPHICLSAVAWTALSAAPSLLSRSPRSDSRQRHNHSQCARVWEINALMVTRLA